MKKISIKTMLIKLTQNAFFQFNEEIFEQLDGIPHSNEVTDSSSFGWHQYI